MCVRRFKIFVVCILLVSTYSCKRTLPTEELVGALKATAELSTSEFVLSKIITAKRTQSVFGIRISPDAVFMAEVEAYVKVGVDIGNLSDQMVYFNNDTLVLKLPAPKVLHFAMPPDKIKPLNDLSREYVFNKFSAAERDHFYRQAETEMRESVVEHGFHKKSRSHIISFFTMFLKQLGFDLFRIEILPA